LSGVATKLVITSRQVRSWATLSRKKSEMNTLDKVVEARIETTNSIYKQGLISLETYLGMMKAHTELYLIWKKGEVK